MGSRLLIVLLLSSSAFAGECVSYLSAGDRLGEIACIKGKVVKIGVGRTGIHFLNFCEDYKTCPFTVVVFPRDLRDVGDVRALEGKEIEITGKVKSYHGQFEIILKDRSQLSGASAALPKIPKQYDVEKRGQYSAGQYSSPKSDNSSKSKGKDKRAEPFPDDQ